jgi:hypothetical protein
MTADRQPLGKVPALTACHRTSACAVFVSSKSNRAGRRVSRVPSCQSRAASRIL